MKKNKIILLVSLIGLFVWQSCSNDILEEVPATSYSDSNFYSTEEGLKAGILGVYAQTQKMYDNYMSVPVMLGTDIAATRYASEYIATFDYFTYTSDENAIYHAWIQYYNGISRSNIIIKSAENSGVDDAVKQRVIAEGKFLRAWFYFRMVQLWGPVPLTLEVSNEEIPRSSVGEIYAQIVKDLIEATANEPLPLTKDATEPGRVTHHAAKTLLGKVYLTMASTKKYAKVDDLLSQVGKEEYGYSSIPESSSELYNKSKAVLNEVINSGTYALLDKYKDNFSIANKNMNSESIWEVQFSKENPSQFTKWMGMATWFPWKWPEAGWGGAGNVAPTPSFMSYYKKGDRRFYWNNPPWRISMINGAEYDQLIDWEDDLDLVVGGQYINHFYWGMGITKYRWTEKWNEWSPYDGVNTPNNGIVLRYADVLLMYAEADLEANGGIASQTAVDLVNDIRNRARQFNDETATGFSPNVAESSTPEFSNYTSGSLDLDAIMLERAFELCYEHHRKFDLLRTNRLQAATQSRLPANPGVGYYSGAFNFNDYRLLWPIPQTEIDIVSDKEGLFQNTGY
ncbi:RagB/SusD family nutrient uptake outer membrane protein [Flavivirga spongiicola]|uniref:RagB/SusD family nutrient uptake outer membrane protein n=1 Tax=Flavivirga spongiicola TaxID=421621 RepID=A0ABU7XQ42_9FLAO|nr:RagB/SusD family nutrient uptake outer membrane protein [Flavivirga sp. MEBiC05379]MDO5977899.1 RagB/SusD family nutrient uptake outer membrane protein [Flavivirga sp. MEBiC05379]